jgi:hypothetical protein
MMSHAVPRPGIRAVSCGLAALAIWGSTSLPAVADQPEAAVQAETDAARMQEDAEGLRAIGRLLGAGFGALRAALGEDQEAAGGGELIEGELLVEPDAAGDGQQQDPQAAIARQQKQQILQHAKHMERFFQPILHAELERGRRSCGGLAPEARKQVLVAGKKAAQKAALEFATQQFNGRGLKPFDARKTIHEAVSSTIKQHAAAEEFSAYESEQQNRVSRRARAARVLIVAKLDSQLELTAEQRQSIEADLEKQWQADWVSELKDTGNVVIGNYRPAPDFAAACITPHLSTGQRQEWKKWCDAAGTQRLSHLHFGWNADEQGLQPDPWWEK